MLCFVFHNLLEYLRFSLFIIGGGIAFYLAKKHPDVITAAFLLHYIPLDGLRFMTVGEELVIFNSLEDLHQSSSILPSTEPDFLNESFKSMSTSPNHIIPRDHKLNEYFTAAAINFPGSQDAGIANVCFNTTPIKTSFSPPSDDLSELKSEVIVIHGSKVSTVHLLLNLGQSQKFLTIRPHANIHQRILLCPGI